MNKKYYKTPSIKAVQFDVDDVVRTSSGQILEPSKTDGEFILEDIFGE